MQSIHLLTYFYFIKLEMLVKGVKKFLDEFYLFYLRRFLAGKARACSSKGVLR